MIFHMMSPRTHHNSYYYLSQNHCLYLLEPHIEACNISSSSEFAEESHSSKTPLVVLSCIKFNFLLQSDQMINLLITKYFSCI